MSSVSRRDYDRINIRFVIFGPLTLKTPADVKAVYDELLKACGPKQKRGPRPGMIREALIACTRLDKVTVFSEQKIYDLAAALKEAGVLYDGQQLEGGGHTLPWIDDAALELWYIATAFHVDEQVGL